MRAAYLIVLSALLLAACSGRREPPPWLRLTEKPRDENYHGGNAAMLLRYDANHDGTVMRDELIRGLRAEFAAHDTRRNACLDADQAAQINQARVDADQSTATPVMDWNQDGCIDYTEFSAAPYSLFDQLDANHDAKIDPKELQRAGAKPRDPGAAAEGREDGEPRGRRPVSTATRWRSAAEWHAVTSAALTRQLGLTGEGYARTSAPFARPAREPLRGRSSVG